MRAAFSCRENRIAPVFDIARRIHTVEVQAGRIVKEGLEILPDDPFAQKALRLTELGIDTLVCGAISRPLQGMVAAHGIRVIPFVAGELQEIVKAWLGGNLRGDAYAMPGCRGRGPRRCRGNVYTEKEGREMPGNRSGGRGPGGGRGQGSGAGNAGPSGPPDAAEPDGTCMCFQCGYRESLDPGIPCRKKVCPRCGGEMGRES